MSLVNYTLYAQKGKFDVSVFRVPPKKEFDWNLLFVVVLFILFFSVFIALVRRRREKHMKKYLQQHKHDWQTVKEKWKVLSKESEDTLAYLDKTMRINSSRLRKNNQIFESAVQRLYEKNPEDPIIEKIQKLREDLGFVFSNKEVSFVCSQMLQPGQSLRVEIEYKGKKYAYVSTVVFSNQVELWIKPPKSKTTDDVLKQANFTFRISRSDTSEYLFTSRLKALLTKPIPALVFSQTKDIKKLHSREFSRYVLNAKKEFVCIAGDSSDVQVTSFIGNIVDVSLGGLKVNVDKLPAGVMKDSYLRFFFKEAKINKPLQVRVLKIYEEEPQTVLHLQFYAMTELNRLCLQNYIATQLQSAIT